MPKLYPRISGAKTLSPPACRCFPRRSTSIGVAHSPCSNSTACSPASRLKPFVMKRSMNLKNSRNWSSVPRSQAYAFALLLTMLAFFVRYALHKYVEPHAPGRGGRAAGGRAGGGGGGG